MLNRILSTIFMLALCLCTGCPTADAFPELQAVAQHACCCDEEVAQACSISDTCCCTISDAGHALPVNSESPSVQSADQQPLAPRDIVAFLSQDVRVLDAGTIRGARRKPLHLASNKVYLYNRSLLI